MRIIFSRKGFDTTSGGKPSPIIYGVPYSLPIPTGKYPSKSKYADLNLGHALSEVNSSCKVDDCCHEDPMFWDDICAFGQVSGAQTQLKNHGVREGDVFLFFGLFAERGNRDRHHRIFGYLNVEKKLEIGSQPTGREVEDSPRQHPHTIAKWDNGQKWEGNNTIYIGRGAKANKAHADLRLTKHKGPASHWAIPKWLRETKLSCHQDSRWLDDMTLRSISPGQEFVTDIGCLPEPKKWLGEMIAAIETDN
jgi:hypothetical protein